MTIQPKRLRKFKIETECIRTLVGIGTPFRVTTKFSSEMHRTGYFLSDVRHVAVTGRVVRSDMLEDLGLWDVRGTTISGVTLTIRFALDSVEGYIEPIKFL